METLTFDSPSSSGSGALIVAAAILDSLATPTRLLAARRTQPAHLAGQWEFPGGKIQPGEPVEAGLRRELREELGVGIRIGELVPAPTDATANDAAGDAGWAPREGRQERNAHHSPAPTHADWPLVGAARMRLWTAEIADGSPAPLEDHDELRWLDLALAAPWGPAHPLLSVPWLAPDVPIVAALHQSLSCAREAQLARPEVGCPE